MSRFLSLQEKEELGIPPTMSFLREDLSNTDKINRLAQDGKKIWKHLNELIKPLPNIADERKAQQIATQLFKDMHCKYSNDKVIMPNYYERQLMNFNIGNENLSDAEQRGMVLFLEKIGENPANYIY